MYYLDISLIAIIISRKAGESLGSFKRKPFGLKKAMC
jgi:hypothetical protein